MSDLPPRQDLKSVQPTAVVSGELYYDKVIFPKIAKDESSFNWVAGLFHMVWLPSKGLWKEFAIWSLPYMAAVAFLEVFHLKVGIIGIGAVIFYKVGKDANKWYYLSCKGGGIGKKSVVFGCLGLVITMIFSSFIGIITDKFVGSSEVSSKPFPVANHLNYGASSQQESVAASIAQTSVPEAGENQTCGSADAAWPSFKEKCFYVATTISFSSTKADRWCRCIAEKTIFYQTVGPSCIFSQEDILKMARSSVADRLCGPIREPL